jgi:hypothetical protein
MTIPSAWAHQVLNLPTDAARCVFEFAYHPANYIHPDRADAGVPQALRQSGLNPRNTSLGLLNMPCLSSWNGLDWGHLQHRVALLPLDGLQALAWRLGLASVAPRLRRVIVRRDWMALSETLSTDDWQWVDAWPGPMAAGAGARARAETAANRHTIGQPLNWLPAEALDDLPLSDWPAHIGAWGWQVLDAACDGLPTDIGARLRLKLPLINTTAQSPKPPQPTLALTALVAAYPSAVAQWNPAWEAMWLPQPTNPQ